MARGPEDDGMNELMTRLGASLIAGQSDTIKALTEDALQAGVAPQEILESAMRRPMEALGERFSRGEAFLPELLLAAHGMKAAMEVLKPALTQGGVEPQATLLIGTVAGDIHDLGKNVVGMMFEGAAFRVVDLGVSVSAAHFLDAYREVRPDLVGLSSLLTTTMHEMGNVIRTVRGAYADARFIVGGAPLSQPFADEIGADGYAPDAHTAVKVATRLLGS